MPQDGAEIVLGLEQVGFEGRGPLVFGRGLLELALNQEDIAQVGVRLGDARPQGDDLAQPRGRLVQPTGAIGALCRSDESAKFGLLSGRRAGCRHQAWSSRFCRGTKQL